MERKVIKQKDSYTITLPMKWVKDHNLEEVRKITLEQEGDQLVVSSSSTQPKAKVITFTRENKDLLIVEVTNAYRNGYDTLTLHLPDKESMDLAEEILDECLGWEIVRREKNTLHIENLTEPNPDNFDSLLRKVCFIIEEDLRMIAEDMNEKLIEKHYYEVLRICHFCRRAIAKNIIGKENERLYVLLIANLGWVHRSVYYLAKEKINDKKTKALLQTCRSAFHEFHQGFFEKDFDKLAQVVTITNEVTEKRASYFTKENGSAAASLLELLRQSRRLCSPAVAILI